MWAQWWVWGLVALGLGILEVLVPAYVFLGFALGAFVTAVILLVGGPLALWLGGSLAGVLLVFAVASLLAWLGLRRALGPRSGETKVFHRDINED